MFEPFWAITKHADITAISKQPELFISRPRLFVNLRVEEMQARSLRTGQPLSLIHI